MARSPAPCTLHLMRKGTLIVMLAAAAVVVAVALAVHLFGSEFVRGLHGRN